MDLELSGTLAVGTDDTDRLNTSSYAYGKVGVSKAINGVTVEGHVTANRYFNEGETDVAVGVGISVPLEKN